MEICELRKTFRQVIYLPPVFVPQGQGHTHGQCIHKPTSQVIRGESEDQFDFNTNMQLSS